MTTVSNYAHDYICCSRSKRLALWQAQTQSEACIVMWLKHYSPWREQIACGAISPKIVITTVDSTKPTTALNRPAIRIDSSALTATFTTTSVHSSRLPLSRTGLILLAHAAALALSPRSMISSPILSRLMKPSVSPDCTVFKCRKSKRFACDKLVCN
eukprot:19784-Heterococcus_DN1.PRE.1